jgi:hypothetical protein
MSPAQHMQAGRAVPPGVLAPHKPLRRSPLMQICKTIQRAPRRARRGRAVQGIDNDNILLCVQTGKTIQRAPRRRGAPGAVVPRKPPGGWPILVTPLQAGLKRGDPYVAQPDGAQRPLTDDERLYLEHFKHEVRMAMETVPVRVLPCLASIVC